MKRIPLLGVAAVAVAVLGLAGYLASVFGGDAPLVDGTRLGPVLTVADGYSGTFMLDAGNGGVALVDAGMDPGGRAILAELGRRRLAPGAVAAIFLTHGHRDHVAACARFPSAAVYALAGEVDLLSGKVAPRGPVPRLFGPSKTAVAVTRALGDGERVTVGRLRVTAFGVPGHTAGSAAFLAEDVLFLGDSAGATRGGDLAAAKWIFSDDTQLNRKSLKALAGRLAAAREPVKWLAFAHTGALEGLGPLEAFAAKVP